MGVAGLNPREDLLDSMSGSERIWWWWLHGYVVVPHD